MESGTIVLCTMCWLIGGTTSVISIHIHTTCNYAQIMYYNSNSIEFDRCSVGNMIYTCNTKSNQAFSLVSKALMAMDSRTHHEEVRTQSVPKMCTTEDQQNKNNNTVYSKHVHTIKPLFKNKLAM